MEIKLKNSADQIELVKRAGSRNKAEADQAMQAIADAIAPTAQKVLDQANTTSEIFEDVPYAEDSHPSILLDLFYATDAGYATVWAQSQAGGVPTNHIDLPIKEMIPATWTLEGAFSCDKKHLRAARLNVLQSVINRIVGEVLVKQERNRWAVLLKALAEANALNGRSVAAGTSGAVQNVVRSAGATLMMKDMTDLDVRLARIHTSFANGTPDLMQSKGLTDIYLSPEVWAQVRTWAFEPVRSDASASASNSNNLPSSVREELFRASGVPFFLGKRWHPMVELGTGKKYNSLFDTFAGSTSFLRIDGLNGSTFAGASDEIIVGLDLGFSPKPFLRPVLTDKDSTFSLRADNQFVERQDKTGMYGSVTEGAVVANSRAMVGIMLG